MMRVSFVIGLCMLVACAKDSSTQSVQTEPERHLKYYGFTLIDTYWDDPLDSEERTNYSDEVYAFSNSADLIALGPADDILGRMMAFEDLEMKTLLHLNELFFELAGTGGPSGLDYDLRPDYQDRWDQFMELNSLDENYELLQALYIGEEPTWNGVSAQELELACDYLEATLPQVPCMIIEAYPVISELVIPNTADWVGFDHYFIADPLNDQVFQTELATLKSLRTDTNQKLVLIMDAHYIDWAHGDFAGIALDDMKDVATSYYDLARQEEDVIALIGYCWPGGFDDPNALGARQMPQSVKEEYERIGREITCKD